MGLLPRWTGRTMEPLPWCKTLDAYREEAGCFSMLFCFLGLLWTGDSTFCCGQCSLGPLQHTPAKEACCPGIGRGDPKWARSCCGRALGSALPGLGTQLADLAHGRSPLTHGKLEAASPERQASPRSVKVREQEGRLLVPVTDDEAGEKSCQFSKSRACLYSKCLVHEIQKPKAIDVESDLPGE